MPKIGNSDYVSKGYLNRLNRNNQQFLSNLYEVLKTSLELDKNEIKQKFENRPWMLKINSEKDLIISTILDKEIYLKLQKILVNKTGRFWQMDEFIEILIFLFIYNEEKKTKKMPLVKRHKGMTYLEMKIKQRFGKYFNNLL